MTPLAGRVKLSEVIRGPYTNATAVGAGMWINGTDWPGIIALVSGCSGGEPYVRVMKSLSSRMS
jgi:hypothetical protein